MKWYKVSDLNAELRAFARCLANGIDLVHFLDGEHCGQFLPRLLSRIGSKARTVVTFHQPAELLEQLLDPAVLPLFDHIVLMSPSQRPYFDGRVPDEKISVILHGVDTEFFHPAETERRRERFRCITVGHWLRDWRLFRSVAERMPSAEFHVVTSRETGSEDLANVHWHVGVDDDTLAALYRSSDVLFLPLQDSTANNALLEGIASGLPGVITDLSAVRAYLPGYEAILARAGDEDAHLSALQLLHKNPLLRERIGKSARARAEALSWPRIATHYETLYARLVART
jgi:glycosyltransferase involved in cell wall biosynthesis